MSILIRIMRSRHLVSRLCWSRRWPRMTYRSELCTTFSTKIVRLLRKILAQYWISSTLGWKVALRRSFPLMYIGRSVAGYCRQMPKFSWPACQRYSHLFLLCGYLCDQAPTQTYTGIGCVLVLVYFSCFYYGCPWA